MRNPIEIKKTVFCELGKIKAIQKKVEGLKSACFCDLQPILGEQNSTFELDPFQPTLMAVDIILEKHC